MAEAGGSDSPRWFLNDAFVTHCNSVTWPMEAGGRRQGLATLAEVAGTIWKVRL